MGLISAGTTIFDAGSLDGSLATGATVLIKTLTADDDANLSFVHGTSSVVLDGTYKQYVFKFINIHPVSDNRIFELHFRDGGSSYDATKCTTVTRTIREEDGSGGNGFTYLVNDDVANGTGDHHLLNGVGNADDESFSGELILYDPANTTFVKHFTARMSMTEATPAASLHYSTGYCNVTAAIDGVKFAMSSGNIQSGQIKLYGIK